MRAVLQRVLRAGVVIGENPVAGIGKGLLALVAVENGDGPQDAQKLSQKIVHLRIFPDGEGMMNLSLIQVAGEILVVSQFTLVASTIKGHRPSYIRSATSAIARPLYELLLECLEKELGRIVARGVFGADMQVSLINDGPVTILLDSRRPE